MGYPDMNLDFTYSSTDASEFPQPGTVVVSDDGLKMVCVYNAGASAIADGDAVGVFTTLANGHVSTTDATMFEIVDGTSTVKAFAGIAVGAIAAGAYGWLIGQGCATAEIATTDGTVVSGGMFALKDATATIYHLVAAAAHLGVGVAHADDSTTTLTGFTIHRSFFVY